MGGDVGNDGAERRILRRNLHVQTARRELDVFPEMRQVLTGPTFQVEVDEQELHWGVARSFTDTERRSVAPLGSGGPGGKAVGDVESAVAVTVPIDPHLDVHFVDELRHEADDARSTYGGSMADRVGDAKPIGPAPDGRSIQLLQNSGHRTCAVLGDVEHG